MKPFQSFQFNSVTFIPSFVYLILLFASLIFSAEETDEIIVPDTSPLKKEITNNNALDSTSKPYSQSPKGVCITDWNFNPKDAIKITVKPDTGFPNGIFVVDGQGYVDLPMIGPLQITSIDKTDFKKIVNETYVPLLRFSNIQVRRVISLSFQGGFQRPGVYWVSPGATLWHALSLTGGVTREDGLRKIKWERNGKIMEKKGADLLKEPLPIMELGLQSGDVIRVINRPDRTGWEIFRQEILPIVSLGISSAVSAITLYEWMQRR